MGNDHRLVEYRFCEIGMVDLKALHCTNGDQIRSVQRRENEWDFALAGGHFSFHSHNYSFIQQWPCDQFGFRNQHNDSE